jgi:hypothetical protein
MKYSININQKALQEISPEITESEAILLDYIYWLCSSVNPKIEKKRIIKDGYKWTWLDYTHLLNEMPILHIKSKSAVSRRVQNIENAGYIKTTKHTRQKMYVKLEPLVEKLITNEKPVFFKKNSSVLLEEHSINNIYINKNNITRESVPEQAQSLDENKKEKFDTRTYIEEKMIHDPKRHIQLLGKFFNTRKLRFDSYDKLQEAIKRHSRAAIRVAKFSDSEIKQAVRVCKDKYRDIDWTLDTILKILTNHNFEDNDI